ncbi:hypothetical protein QQG55_15860 [Brugia pahangi]
MVVYPLIKRGYGTQCLDKSQCHTDYHEYIENTRLSIRVQTCVVKKYSLKFTSLLHQSVVEHHFYNSMVFDDHFTRMTISCVCQLFCKRPNCRNMN